MRRLLGVAALMLAVMVPAAPAAGAWTAPFDLSASSAVVPRVAVGANGSTLFAWQRSDGTNQRIQARARSAAGALGVVQDVSPAGQESITPNLAVDDSGDAALAWAHYTGLYQVQARPRSSAGVLGAVQNISVASPVVPSIQVAVDADGDAVFAWLGYDGTKSRVQARARSAAGVLSPIQTLSPAGQNASNPQLAIDDSGDSVFAWERFDGTANFRIEARARSAAGVLSPVRKVSPPGQNGFDPKVAVDSNGDSVLAWRGFDGVNSRVQARARSAAGTLSATAFISPAGQNASAPQVAVDATNDAVITWTRPQGASQRVQARARSAAGTLSAVQNLSNAGQNAFVPQVAVDNTGDAVFTWRRSDGTFDRIQARARSAAGVLGTTANLSLSGQNAAEPDVGIDAGGDAVVVWKRGTTSRIQGAAGP